MFNLSESQNAQVEEFIVKHRKVDTGATGGQFTWKFTPTSIGVAVVVVDNSSKEEIDVSDYENW